MANGKDLWNIETVPQEFWDRIEEADRNKDRFQQSLSNLSESELRTVFEQYKGLSESLVVSGYESFPESVREKPVENIEEIANWVITQGKAYYQEILNNPDKFPTRDQIRRPIFAGAIIAEYTRRFGPWRA